MEEMKVLTMTEVAGAEGDWMASSVEFLRRWAPLTPPSPLLPISFVAEVSTGSLAEALPSPRRRRRACRRASLPRGALSFLRRSEDRPLAPRRCVTLHQSRRRPAAAPQTPPASSSLALPRERLTPHRLWRSTPPTSSWLLPSSPPSSMRTSSSPPDDVVEWIRQLPPVTPSLSKSLWRLLASPTSSPTGRPLRAALQG